MNSESRDPILNEQGGEHILPSKNNDGKVLGTEGYRKDWNKPRYSTSQLGPPPQTMDDNQVPFQRKKGKVRILPNKKQVVGRKTPKKPYFMVCIFEETDGVTELTKNNYKVAMGLGITSSRMRLINRFFNTSGGSNIHREDLVEPDCLP